MQQLAREKISFNDQTAGDEKNIILNPGFEDGLNNWSGRGCKIVLRESMGEGKVVPLTGKYFASTSGRTQSWNGIQQEITARVQRKLAYEVNAVVRIFGSSSSSATLQATLYVQSPNGREQYISIARVQATDKEWVQLKGKFLLNTVGSRVIIYLEGPPPGIDILLNSMEVKHAHKIPPSPPPENVWYGENIITNSDFSDGLNGWLPLGPCTLSVATEGAPRLLSPTAAESLASHEPLNGRFVAVSNRTATWMGPSQTVTEKITPFVTYQVAAWVRVSTARNGAQNVNVALGVDDQYVNGGQVEAGDDRWYEIGGSFRIEKKPSRVIVYVQGPEPGVDLMVSGLHVFAVDRKARFKYLQRRTDEVRKRDVVVKVSGYSADCISGAYVKVTQTKSSFPIGSCINRTDIENEEFVSFLLRNFNWAVFGNELKWYWTEPQQGSFNYADADELVDFCNKNQLKMRGHCIFWEVESAVQPWVKSLSRSSLLAAVQNRLNGLLTRYKGKFQHYDVNNEMLHGSFYQDHLGKDIRAFMFKTAHQLDPSPLLFVNDYHVEDGADTRSSPERYIKQILDLQDQGAPVGGIGVQGHIDYPVGPIIRSALDKLSVLGLPIWFTEVDVSSSNEYVRADDLETMLREAYAHPAVEGVMLWGYWELMMSREDGQLVDAEGEVNEAGRRFLELKEEWASSAAGKVNADGEFVFRGFHGDYRVEVVGLGKSITESFTVEKGDCPLVVHISL
ncbi:Putative Pol polyprotein from transposon element Bs1 [Apostasia shenzhenica]|uniref:Pol polyprotein from transposon element Bs1 n=1 Tax=Apostasia shenzhenica TaxID=1088818 RepID=A0A2I0AF95_9ASPA|nr:Putative Pol polyprotein from transposon element Bs1 [Apostasia shenzhenica]